MNMKQKQECLVPAKYIRSNGSVLDFTGLYEVSDQGNVRSLNYHNTRKTRIMNPGTYRNKDESIFYQVMLCLNNKRYLLLVHRLILSSFKESEYFPRAVCDHIVARTESCCNNCLSNLHWITQQQNGSTERCKTLKSKANTNRQDQSKRVRVKNLTSGEITVYPSASEAERTIGLSWCTIAVRINKYEGFYKKMNLQFSYID